MLTLLASLAAAAPLDHVDALVAARATCALRRGEVWCWGPVGPGSEVWHHARRIEGLKGAVELDGSSSTFCARTRRGLVRCWGDLPERWAGGTLVEKGAEDIAVLRDAVCVLERGEARCRGQDGTWHDVLSGVRTLIGQGASQLCAAGMDDDVRCSRPAGAEGWVESISTRAPGRVEQLLWHGGLCVFDGAMVHCLERETWRPVAEAQRVVANRGVLCTRHRGAGTCRRASFDTRAVETTWDGELVAVGDAHTCRVQEGRVACRGQADAGRLGDALGPYWRPVGTYTRSEPATGDRGTSATLAGATDLVKRHRTTCGLVQGSLRCESWGDATVPEQLEGPFETFAVGTGIACGLEPTGTMRCAGDHGTSELADVRSMTLGAEQGVVLRENGSLQRFDLASGPVAPVPLTTRSVKAPWAAPRSVSDVVELVGDDHETHDVCWRTREATSCLVPFDKEGFAEDLATGGSVTQVDVGTGFRCVVADRQLSCGHTFAESDVFTSSNLWPVALPDVEEVVLAPSRWGGAPRVPVPAGTGCARLTTGDWLCWRMLEPVSDVREHYLPVAREERP